MSISLDMIKLTDKHRLTQIFDFMHNLCLSVKIREPFYVPQGLLQVANGGFFE
jgi:hypothetical protein